ncbi:protease pro-enzyme activation domain-containing protein [Amycolatopsis sp. NPDC059021]|uniref:S53 family peptidase n=1 Tax=Amycolatopsis sp. NPDC059021 TaxID=3346704 RepID=UPI00366DD326
MRRNRFRWTVVAVCVTALTTAGAAAAEAAPDRVPLAGTKMTWELVDKGPVPVDTPASETVYLSVKDPETLARQAKEVSDPNSRDYGRFLGRDRIRENHRLGRAQVDRVRAWLTGAGLSVTEPDWRHLQVTGTFGQLNAAFAVTFHDYVFPPESGIKGHYLAPPTDLSVPAELGALVLGVGQIPIVVRDAGQAAAPRRSAERRPHLDAGATAKQCSQYWGERPATGLPQVNGATPPLAPCGYTPKQLRHAYGLDSLGVTGAGQTVAVVSSSMDTLEKDINTWSDRVGTQRLRPGQLTRVPSPDGSPPEQPGNGGYAAMIEAAIDTESVHGIAPDANIVAIGESTAQGGSLLAGLSYALDHTDASIVSLSLANDPPPGLRKAFDQVYQEGALQGVGFYFCTGDGGFRPNDTGGDWLNGYAGSGWVTAVGGTSVAIGRDGKRVWETGWGSPVSQLSQNGASWEQPQSDGGTGGGRATDRPQPWYQHGVVPDRYAATPDGNRSRVGPDVAFDADPATGMVIGGTPLDGSEITDPGSWHYAEHTFGGTSLSTPLFAGVQALAQQARGGKRFGFANPVLYRRAGTSAFRDVTAYRLPSGDPATAVRYRSNPGGGTTPELYHFLATQWVEKTGTYQPPEVGPGFDTETGLGTPAGDYLRSFLGH